MQGDCWESENLCTRATAHEYLAGAGTRGFSINAPGRQVLLSPPLCKQMGLGTERLISLHKVTQTAVAEVGQKLGCSDWGD